MIAYISIRAELLFTLLHSFPKGKQRGGIFFALKLFWSEPAVNRPRLAVFNQQSRSKKKYDVFIDRGSS